MPDLLIELFSEEIPARMQRRAAEDLRRLVTDALVERGLAYEGAKAFATPRRLALAVAGLPAKGRDVREERRGPRVGAPDAAVQGFLKSAGLASLDQAKVERDPKKGEFYVAVIERPGRPTQEVVAEIVPPIVRGFPWPKAMRWGPASREPGALRWVRPLHGIVCTFGPETEDPEVVPVAVDGIVAGDVTHGHRFMSPGAIRVKRLADYAASLERARVVLDADRRKDMILHDARDLAFAQGFALVEDEALLEEVAGLVEWPVVLMGTFDESFLAIPPEVIRATIRANQKCFVLRAPSPSPVQEEGGARVSEGRERERSAAGTLSPLPVGFADHPPPQSGEGGGRLANRFILVSNIEATDGGRAVVAGNERVVRARLSDAKFFWETDLKTPLADRLDRLKSIVFHEKLGTQYERVERIAALARELAPAVGADPALAERAARLAKADLVTEMVGEFPELQGLMGRYYAQAQGEPPSVAAAIEEHYKPLGPSDRVPTDPVSIAVALADKIDTLVGFWAIDEKPTGSKDPYALRRATLGVIRIVLSNELRVDLRDVVQGATNGIVVQRPELLRELANARSTGDEPVRATLARNLDLYSSRGVRDFFVDRLKVHLREQGARHDLIDAVFALGASSSPPAGESLPSGTDPRVTGPEGEGAGGAAGGLSGATPTPGPSPQGGGESVQDDLLLIVRRVEALGRFLDTEDGRNLLAGYRRAANILRIEEKRDARAYDALPDAALLAQDEERTLAAALDAAREAASRAVGREDFEGAMRALSRLRAPVDAFFDKVTVNADDPALRENRLKLLNAIRAATREVADFSRIEG